MTAERKRPSPMKLLDRLFKSAPDPRERLRPLWHRVVAISREPAWYAECGVADTVPGRFDMVAAVLALVLLRLERDDDGAAPAALLTELFVEDMDGQLRESGVGDIVVGKHIGRLMASLGGRLGAYRAALAEPGDEALEEAVARNVTLLEGHESAALARRLRAFADRLGSLPAEELLAGAIER
jgi:cytochrome b pre-mRNA-processing protein 3